MATIEFDAPPSEVTQGATAAWTMSWSDHPATGWALAFVIVNGRGGNEQNRVTLTGVADGNAFDVTLPHTTSDDMQVGTWIWQAWVTKNDDSERYLKAVGRMEVKADLTNATIPPTDTRSNDERELEMLDELLGDSAVVRQLDPAQYSELARERYHRRKQVELERHKAALAAGEPAITKIKVQFR